MSAMPTASFATKSPLDRLLRQGASRGADETGLLLEEVFGSLRQDRYVLLRTREAVECCIPPAGSEDLLKESGEKCRERLAECSLTGAWLALRFGSNRQVRAWLAEVLGDPSVVPEGLRALAAQICVSAAWSAPSRSEADWLLEGARRLDSGDGGRWSLDGLRRLLAARGEIQAGRVGEAIRECLVLTEETDRSDPLHAVGLELMADGFQRMGDEGRELAALERWTGCFANGPCGAAVRAETSGGAPGILGSSRSREILEHLSRYASLCERSAEGRPQAREMYVQCLDAGFHEWTDPRAPGMGTFRQRLERLEGTSRAPTEVPTAFRNVLILEPERSHTRLLENAPEMLAKAIASLPWGWAGAVLLQRVEIRERQHLYRDDAGDPTEGLRESIQDIDRETRGQSQPVAVEKVDVERNGKRKPWLLISYRDLPEDLRRLTFGIEVVSVGNRIEWSLWVLLLWTQVPGEEGARELRALLTRKPDELSGLGALKSQTLDLAKRAIRRLGTAGPAAPTGDREAEGFTEL